MEDPVDHGLHVKFFADLRVLGPLLDTKTDGSEGAANAVVVDMGPVAMKLRQQPGVGGRLLTVEVSFPFNASRTDSEIRARGRALVDHVADILALESEVPTRVDDNVRDDLDTTRERYARLRDPARTGVGTTIAGRAFVFATGSVSRVLDLQQVADRIAARVSTTAPSPLLRAFRAMRSVGDPVASFVMSYAFLLLATRDHLGEAQELVEDAIEKHRPSRQTEPIAPRPPGRRPPRTPKPTTVSVFTAVRNRLAHPGDKNADLHQVLEEAARESHELATIATEVARDLT